MNWTDRDKVMLCIFGALGLAIVLLAVAHKWWRVI